MLPLIVIATEVNELRYLWNLVRWTGRLDYLREVIFKNTDKAKNDDDRAIRKLDEAQKMINNLSDRPLSRSESYDQFSPGQNIYLTLLLETCRSMLTAVNPSIGISVSDTWQATKRILLDSRYKDVHQDASSWTGLVTTLILRQFFSKLPISPSDIENVLLRLQSARFEDNTVFNMLAQKGTMDVYLRELKSASPDMATAIQQLTDYMIAHKSQDEVILTLYKLTKGRLTPANSLFGKAYALAKSDEYAMSPFYVTSGGITITPLVFDKNNNQDNRIATPHTVSLRASDIKNYEQDTFGPDKLRRSLHLTQADNSDTQFVNLTSY